MTIIYKGVIKLKGLKPQPFECSNNGKSPFSDGTLPQYYGLAPKGEEEYVAYYATYRVKFDGSGREVSRKPLDEYYL